MKNKFITASKENIAKYKEKYFQEIFNGLKEKNKKIYFDEEMPTDEELTKSVNFSFDPKNMSNHKTLTPKTNIDYYEYIKMIQKADVEHELVVLLDENKKPISSKVVNNGTVVGVGEIGKPGHKVWSYVLNEPKAKYIIHVHNHPHAVAALPSFSDKLQILRHKMIGNLLNVKLLDACIISEFDFYSQYQFEEKNSKNNLLEYQIPKEVTKELATQNWLMYSMLKQTVEGYH